MAKRHKKNTHKNNNFGRRRVLQTTGAIIAGAPFLYLPKLVAARTNGIIKHLLYVRLNGGFRFTAAYNGEVAEQFNPWGLASTPDGTEWGASRLLEGAAWLTEDLRTQGMLPANEIANHIAVIPCVDHEPLSSRADGNHQTGLERYYTGFAGGDTAFFTMINYGLREFVATGGNATSTLLPAFSLGSSGMAIGAGEYSAYRPPVVEGTSFERFRSISDENLPEWARDFAKAEDIRMRDRQNPAHQIKVDAYIKSREANARFNQIFSSDALNIDSNSDEPIDGLSNRQLADMFGNGRGGRSARMALRLFHYGSPAVYFGEGGYDYHSDEQARLPDSMQEPNRLMSALYTALTTMSHPDGGTYWDHTLVVFGSEFGRTGRGSRFNSAQGSDHNSDNATRWMSMPVMGGVIDAAGNGGRSFGRTRPADLEAEGKVYSYRSLLKTLINMLGGDHQPFFQGDQPFEDLVL